MVEKAIASTSLVEVLGRIIGKEPKNFFKPPPQGGKKTEVLNLSFS